MDDRLGRCQSGGSKSYKPKFFLHCQSKKLIILFNKSEYNAHTKEELATMFANIEREVILFPPRKRENITTLEEKLVQAIYLPEISLNDIIITNARHYEALTKP